MDVRGVIHSLEEFQGLEGPWECFTRIPCFIDGQTDPMFHRWTNGGPENGGNLAEITRLLGGNVLDS